MTKELVWMLSWMTIDWVPRVIDSEVKLWLRLTLSLEPLWLGPWMWMSRLR